MKNDPDKAWVVSAQNGDKSAFGELVNRYYEMVYAISYGVLENREQSRDVTQEVFLKVYNTIRAFKGDSKFKTWLYRVVMNAAIDQTRKKKPVYSLDEVREGEEDGKPIDIPDEKAKPRDEIYQQELKILFSKALEELSPEHRAVLVLREWQDMSYEEISETLGIQLGTVMSRLHYAKKKLAEIMEAKYPKGKLL